jgi:hypothetical protein
MHSDFFNKIHDKVKMHRSEYNYSSLNLLLAIFSNENIQQDLIKLRNFLERLKTIDGKAFRRVLDSSYISF